MKKIIILLMIILMSCDKEVAIKKAEVLDSFGNARIDMTFDDFQEKFRDFKITTPFVKGYAEIEINSIRINDSIVIKNVYANFVENKLACISIRYNKKFFNYLKSRYGVRSDYNPDGIRFIDFETNTKKIYCSFEGNKNYQVIGLYKHGWSHY